MLRFPPPALRMIVLWFFSQFVLFLILLFRYYGFLLSWLYRLDALFIVGIWFFGMFGADVWNNLMPRCFVSYLIVFSWDFWWIYNVVFVEAFRPCFFFTMLILPFWRLVCLCFSVFIVFWDWCVLRLRCCIVWCIYKLFFLNFVLRNPRFYSPSCAGAGFSLRRICHFRAPFGFVALLFFGAWGWWA